MRTEYVCFLAIWPNLILSLWMGPWYELVSRTQTLTGCLGVTTAICYKVEKMCTYTRRTRCRTAPLNATARTKWAGGHPACKVERLTLKGRSVKSKTWYVKWSYAPFSSVQCLGRGGLMSRWTRSTVRPLSGAPLNKSLFISERHFGTLFRKATK